MLIENPWAFVTQFQKGRRPLPDLADIERLKARTENAYCTSTTATTTATRSGVVDKTMNEVVKSRRLVRKTPGHIRLRIPVDTPEPTGLVELFDGAVLL